TGSLRHRVEPRHGKGLTPAVALLDHGDGREYLPRRHGRPSLAAHRSKKIGDHVVSYPGERAHLRPQPHLARTPASGQSDRVPGQDAALQCVLVSHDSKCVRQPAQPAQVDHTGAPRPRELDARDGFTAPHGIVLVPSDARPRAEPPTDHVQRVGTHILKHPFAGSPATERAPARQGPVERRALMDLLWVGDDRRFDVVQHFPMVRGGAARSELLLRGSGTTGVVIHDDQMVRHARDGCQRRKMKGPGDGSTSHDRNPYAHAFLPIGGDRAPFLSRQEACTTCRVASPPRAILLAPFVRSSGPTSIGKRVREMCGLVVMVGLGGRKADAAILTGMAQSLAHRGPDDSGLYLDDQVGFGFRRLSILDLSATGHQPMVSEDGQFVIVFNGEIYNYLELRDELRAAGFCFRSTSDTEVLLAAYRQWGPGCLTRLNGMWAFVIHDRRRSVLFGARDRFGVKPLFLHQGKDSWLFASEIKAS